MGVDRRRIADGDWQTPRALADAVVARLADDGVDPALVIEPTCGVGTFLAAARARWPAATLRGFERHPAHVVQARAQLGDVVTEADFFDVDWDGVLGAGGPVLVLGNPPWVTRAALGALGARGDGPVRTSAGLAGLDAITGRSNFDLSEVMIRRLLACASADTELAMLCKASVARKVIALEPGFRGEVRAIDAGRAFGVGVGAVLLRARRGAVRGWPSFDALDAATPSATLGVVDGELTCDVDRFLATRRYAGAGGPVWRSGIKHDAAAVFELARTGRGLRDQHGESVDVEDDVVFPLLKGGDVFHGRAPSRALLVTQRSLGDDTRRLADEAPRAWAYLQRHRAALDGRKSRIYAGRPPFSIFGVGGYAFAPWKVAVSGLHKALRFRLVGPHEGRPVVLDDTCALLSFDAEGDAREALALLTSDRATDFFESRVFWDAKRPLGKALLQRLDLGALALG